MRKIINLTLALLLSICCVQKSPEVDRITEDGVEVVLNHQEPYELSNLPLLLRLQKKFSLDTEDNALAEKGITDIYLFDLDNAGNIFIMRPPTGKGDLVYVLSSDGKLISTFGEFGQGPFELEYPSDIVITPNNEAWILESPKNKYHVFSNNGDGVYEKTLEFGFETIIPLLNGNYLLTRLVIGDVEEAKYFSIAISIYDSLFHELLELDRFSKRPNRQMAPKFQEKIVNGIGYVVQGKAFKDRIYVANSDRGYEILIYDTEGELLQKIRKEYNPVPVTQSYKTEYIKKYEEFMPEYAKTIYFPTNWHPFHSFFLDESGKLFVMTYESGNNNGEFIYDVFNEDGIFFHRTSFNILHGNYGFLYAKAKGGRLYCIQEKDSGFKELVVYEMIWETEEIKSRRDH